jgi:hypothetical protein
MVPQDEGSAQEFPGGVHDRHITSQVFSRNESWNA